MPYFKKERILLIHIPKTGGTSVEKYLSLRTKTALEPNSLYFRYYPNTIQDEVDKYRRAWKTQAANIMAKTADKKKGVLNCTLSPHLEMQYIDDASENSDEDYNIGNRKYSMPEYRKFKQVELASTLGHSLQHLTWREMQQYKDILWENDTQRNIVSENLYQRNECEIITIVRNPYDRVVSDLLFNDIINETTIQKPKIVCDKLKKYLAKDDTFDNHKIPQYLFVTNEHDELIENMIILRTETLTADMKHVGFVDFNYNLQASKNCIESKETKYSAALNKRSIALINEYYRRDFELFGYTMLE